MRFAFVDIAYGYTADRPEKNEALGGTTSAVCFLARELVKNGIGCTFFNKITEPQTAHEIPSLPLDQLIGELANPDYAAVIFCGRWLDGMVKLVGASTQAPLIAWMHESAFNPKLVPALEAFKGIVFVSEWQKRINQPAVQKHWKQVVIRNAMNPAAANMFAGVDSIVDIKIKPPTLLYAGNFARGAFHLPKILNILRAEHRDFTAEIFCNTNPSGNAEADAEYIKSMKAIQGVTHIGMVGQTELIRRMRRASIFVAPNPWPETSCIAMIEAMAAGLSVVTTNRAVLPETASGFAQHVNIDYPNDPVRFDALVPPDKFAAAIGKIMDEWHDQPDSIERHLRTQTDHFNANYQWSQRVKPWVDFVKVLTN